MGECLVECSVEILGGRIYHGVNLRRNVQGEFVWDVRGEIFQEGGFSWG